MPQGGMFRSVFSDIIVRSVKLHIVLVILSWRHWCQIRIPPGSLVSELGCLVCPCPVNMQIGIKWLKNKTNGTVGIGSDLVTSTLGLLPKLQVQIHKLLVQKFKIETSVDSFESESVSQPMAGLYCTHMPHLYQLLLLARCGNQMTKVPAPPITNR